MASPKLTVAVLRSLGLSPQDSDHVLFNLELEQDLRFSYLACKLYAEGRTGYISLQVFKKLTMTQKFRILIIGANFEAELKSGA